VVNKILILDFWIILGGQVVCLKISYVQKYNQSNHPSLQERIKSDSGSYGEFSRFSLNCHELSGDRSYVANPFTYKQKVVVVEGQGGIFALDVGHIVGPSNYSH